MTFDVCFAVYNSSQWIKTCINAFNKLDYDKKAIALYFADNASTDDSVEILEELRQQYGQEFAAFEIIQMNANTGFGSASNAAARQGKGEYVFFCNLDTEIMPDALKELEKAINQSERNVGAFEMRQFPYEHPKYYNPITMAVSYASGACFILRRPVFDETGGFDETFFMYAEDVDLSWRIRVLGYTIQYVPAAVINHYAYQEKDEIKPMQLSGNLAGNLAIRYKFSPEDDIRGWQAIYDDVQRRFADDPDLLLKIDEMLISVNKNKKKYRAYYNAHVKNAKSFVPYYSGAGYNFARAGAFYENRSPASSPFFSVIVRTYRRPQLLLQTLKSLCNQTYKNFEVVVVEDGEIPVSEAAVDSMRPVLNITYHAMKSQNGHCITGNKGIELSQGDFLCFLDDDDYFFAEHLEVMASLISQNPKGKLFAAGSVQARCNSDNSQADVFEPECLINLSHEKIRPIDICMDNLFPVQAAVFHRSLPETYGGLDEEMINGYEDWEMWIRFSMHTQLILTEKATSIFRVPVQAAVREQRAIRMFSNMPELAAKIEKYTIEVNARDLLELRYSQDAVEEITRQYETRADLLKVAEAIVSSNIWRRTKFIRAVPLFIVRCFECIVILFGRALGGLSRMAERVGPGDPDLTKSGIDIQVLYHFIGVSRNSLSWRLPMFFVKRKNERQNKK